MPAPLVECVPNFSEGRDRATLEALERAITSVPGAKLLDVQADAAHHRSVFTFVAPPGAAVEAALRAMRVATERIDLTRHTGEHPRVGATDVVPFVPVRDVTMDDCVALARRLAERAAAELGIPIYLYARAATRPERERLPDIRKGGFEGGGQAQVSMNLLDIDTTSPVTAFAAIEAEARRRGVGVARSEIVGLIPERGILGAGSACLKCPDAMDHVLEAKIREREGAPLDPWLDELASGTPAPGGGSAVALAAAMAGALVAMVARLTLGRQAYAAVAERVEALLAEAEEARRALRALVDLDAAAYGAVMSAYAIPKDQPQRTHAIDEALLQAARPPMTTARSAARLALLAREIGQMGNKNARSDAKVAELLARAAGRGALENVRVNLAAMSQPSKGRELLEEAERLERDVREP